MKTITPYLKNPAIIALRIEDLAKVLPREFGWILSGSKRQIYFSNENTEMTALRMLRAASSDKEKILVAIVCDGSDTSRLRLQAIKWLKDNGIEMEMKTSTKSSCINSSNSDGDGQGGEWIDEEVETYFLKE